MTVDASLEFEKRRNVPLRYDREVMAKTVEVIKRVQAIKSKREMAHYKQRIMAAKLTEKEHNTEKLMETEKHKQKKLVKVPEVATARRVSARQAAQDKRMQVDA